MSENDAGGVLQALIEGIAFGRETFTKLSHLAPDDHLWRRVADAITDAVSERLTALLAERR